MGLVTFCVIMYEATPEGGISEVEENWISSIDFSHVYLFFVTFFFVMHAIFLMVMSMGSAASYQSMFTEKTSDLCAAMEDAKDKKNSWCNFSIFAGSSFSLQKRVEFMLLHSLFKKTYLLPYEFDFPNYLSGCFDRFALRTINRSLFTWWVLLGMVGLNYGRIFMGWTNCLVEGEEGEGEGGEPLEGGSEGGKSNMKQ